MYLTTTLVPVDIVGWRSRSIVPPELVEVDVQGHNLVHRRRPETKKKINKSTGLTKKFAKIYFR